MKILKKIINQNKLAIAAVHLPPTEGYKDFVSYEYVREALLHDIEAVQNAGFDSMIIENNYDLPHHVYLQPHTVLFLRRLLTDIRSKIEIPFGLSILWNDYKTAFSLGREVEASFIRIPVFVDTVKTAFGKVDPVARESVVYRQMLGCEDVEIFADIHVKHSTILNTDTIAESAQKAVDSKADALIVTGKWTADSPSITDLQEVRDSVHDFPIVVGSGATAGSLNQLLPLVDSIIVGTALKPGIADEAERNMKPFDARIDSDLATAFMTKFNSLRK